MRFIAQNVVKCGSLERMRAGRTGNKEFTRHGLNLIMISISASCAKQLTDYDRLPWACRDFVTFVAISFSRAGNVAGDRCLELIHCLLLTGLLLPASLGRFNQVWVNRQYRASPRCKLLRSDASDWLLAWQGLCSQGLAAAVWQWDSAHVSYCALCMWCAFTRMRPALPTTPAYAPGLTMFYWVKRLIIFVP